MGKRILVLSGNPKENSFSELLADAYVEAARQQHEVRLHKIANMDFNPDLTEGYSQVKTLEPDLIDFQQSIQWSEHLVITTPIWWGALPAKFKGLFDRTFLPGFAFNYQRGKLIPDKLLKGKTARIIMTMDTPTWYYRYFQGAPALKQLQKTTLEFCGFSRVRHNMLGPVINSHAATREQWLTLARQLGKDAK